MSIQTNFPVAIHGCTTIELYCHECGNAQMELFKRGIDNFFSAGLYEQCKSSAIKLGWKFFIFEGKQEVLCPKCAIA